MQERGIQVFDRSHPLSPTVLGAVAVGGAFGAAGRWLVAWGLDEAGGAHTPGAWPWATLVVNLLGCALIGSAARAYAARDTIAWAFAVTGILGGFTTFSTFAVELNDLADAGRAALAILYASVTIVGGVAAVAIAGPRGGRAWITRGAPARHDAPQEAADRDPL